MSTYFEAMTPEQAYWESEYQRQYRQLYEIDIDLWEPDQVEQMLNDAAIGEAQASGLDADFYKRAANWGREGEI